MPESQKREGCDFTRAVERATGDIPGPKTYGCDLVKPMVPITIKVSPVYIERSGDPFPRKLEVVSACAEHAKQLRTFGYVAD